MVESYLSEVIEDWAKDIDQQALKIEDAAVREEFYAYHGEDYDELQKYRLILMNSFFTTSFALFQSELEMMCNFAKERTGTPFSVEDFGSRDYTNNAKVYLEKLNVTFPRDTPEWRKIRIYQGIRNKIMHEDGFVGRDWKYFDEAKGMGILPFRGDFGELKLSRLICEQAVNDFERFLLMVHAAIADL